MSTQQDDWSDDELSMTELVQGLLRRWKAIALFTSTVTVVSAIYFIGRPPLSDARMRFDESKYQILFDAEYPLAPGQHSALARSDEFLTQVNKRLTRESLVDGQHITAGSVFGVSSSEQGGEAVLFISARLPESKAALRSLGIWAEEYKKIAARYRAKRLLYDQQQQLQTGLASLNLHESTWKKFRQSAELQTAMNTGDYVQHSASSNRIEELQNTLVALRYSTSFSRELIRGLEALCEKNSFDTRAESSTNAPDVALQYAWGLVQADIDQLLGKPESIPRRNTTKAKIIVVFFLALGFASAAALVVEGTRVRQVRC